MALASPPRLSFLQKGKAKATEQHFDDLNPIITYRHLHSQNLGVRDPLRVIALCDSDAFYAACEMVRLGTDKDTPLVVLQWESLIAVNYPARKYGISRMDKLKDAKRRCPELVIVHVATYKEGEKEPGYWKNVDTNTHKVCLWMNSMMACSFSDGCATTLPCQGVPGLLPTRKHEDRCYVQGGFARMRDR